MFAFDLIWTGLTGSILILSCALLAWPQKVEVPLVMIIGAPDTRESSRPETENHTSTAPFTMLDVMLASEVFLFIDPVLLEGMVADFTEVNLTAGK